MKLIKLILLKGFLEKELKKDEIEVFDNGDNPLAPAPREMIDLEVTLSFLASFVDLIFVVVSN